MEGAQEKEVEYRDIDGFPGYRVGNDGSVWSIWKRKGLGMGKGGTYVMGNEWKMMKTSIDSNGYPSVSLKGKTTTVHRLVLRAFVGPRPKGMDACHFPDQTKTNCHLSNLRWDTKKENMEDARRHGSLRMGESHAMCKYSDEKVLLVRKMAESGVRQADIARALGMPKQTVNEMVKRVKRKNI